MRYVTKSAIIGRKQHNEGDDQNRPCFVSLFKMNDPHKKNEVPDKILEFESIHKVIITGLDVNYLLPGNDLVINNLEHIDVKEDKEKPHLLVSGKQKH